MSSPASGLEPPSGGTPPPDRLHVAGAGTLFLAPVAHEAAERHRDEFPDERERYGDAGFEWCVHDLQYVLAWAVFDETTPGVLGDRLRWLANLLAAREYDVRRLARSVELLGEVVAERHPAADGLVRRLRGAGADLAT